MELTKKQEAAQQIMRSVIAKCWEDEAFKQALIADPVATLEKFTGNEINLPEGKRLVVRDQSSEANAIYFNIPAEPNLEELQLSDEQLELVAGGVTPVAAYFTVLAAGVAVGAILF
ncbi:putative ribosomally synthesized peptide [Kordia periserrulae]|uniref:Putative ribosomally synthesized peptide n=1 Tax=Kordia periserrulae TaxID=701523 RepID=A0A2T6C1G2_9FLAO|nr:NHLP leader peptide family RiPP precursor [Kordia periserrulae]PTX62156.1 putative ribosomally synthesized peptide [Kordia periserrulae]